MTERRINLCNTGTRCHICTGCGRCFGQEDGIHVLTDGNLGEIRHNTGDAEEKRDIKCTEDSILEKDVIAVDIGTTTIAMVLYDQEGREKDVFVTVNPQVKYGADVLSRISAAKEPWAAKDMQRQVREVLARGIRQFLSLQPGELTMIIAANTTMVYLLLGLDPAELGSAPFQARHLWVQELTVEGVKGVILPGVSAFVGGDVAAGIYACAMAEKEEITLFIDLGTNGEMAIGNRNGILACSTAAGPAFEGGATRGIWGADMVHLTARLLQSGIVDETGLLAEAYFDQGILIGSTRITQQAIRELQLAKAAIAAGIGTLTRAYGLESMEGIDRVVLAGGFGYYLQAADAARIGLLPAGLCHKVISGGNTALAGIRRLITEGAYTLVRSNTSSVAGTVAGADSGIEKIVRLARVMNLAEQDAFKEQYIEAMYLKKW